MTNMESRFRICKWFVSANFNCVAIEVWQHGVSNGGGGQAAGYRDAA